MITRLKRIKVNGGEHEYTDIWHQKEFRYQEGGTFFHRTGKFQSIDLKEKGLSKGEFQSVLQAVGGLEMMIDPDCKDKDLLALIRYLAPEDKTQKVFENQTVIKMPVVRNGREATVGYCPEIWKRWS